MRILFIATGDIALPAFHLLLGDGPRPVALVTQPDKPAGRRQTLTPPAIKTAAITAGIPVYQPEKIGTIASELAALEPDVIVVAAYGQILPACILALPRLAIINLHASLLPKYRGAACIQAALDAGDAVTGITAMHVVKQLDAGDIILARSLPITSTDTGGSLHDRLADLAAAVLGETLDQLASGRATRTPQDPTLASYVPKLDRDHGRIDWTQPAVAIERRIRAYDPWPGTFTQAVHGASTRRLKVFPPSKVIDSDLPPGQVSIAEGRLLIGCGDGALELTTVQPEGGKKMSVVDYLRGHSPEAVL